MSKKKEQVPERECADAIPKTDFAVLVEGGAFVAVMDDPRD